MKKKKENTHGGKVLVLPQVLNKNLSKLNQKEKLHAPQIKWLFSRMLLLPFSPSLAAHNQLQKLTWSKKRIDSNWQITDWLWSSRIDSWRRGGDRNRRAVYIILKTCDIHIPLSLHWSALVNACLIGEFKHYKLILCLWSHVSVDSHRVGVTVKKNKLNAHNILD